nr:hypothetical protein BAR15_90054 [Bartonella sp. AR 15-3]
MLHTSFKISVVKMIQTQKNHNYTREFYFFLFVDIKTEHCSHKARYFQNFLITKIRVTE